MMDQSKLTRREYLRHLSVVAAGVTLAACGAAPTPGGQAQAGQSTSTNGSAGSAPVTANTPNGEAVSLVFWNQSKGDDLKSFCTSGPRFQQSAAGSGITIQCTGFDTLDKVLAATAAG